jgi:MraZ protein
MFFTGRYQGVVDVKGRMTVPSPLRSRLGSEDVYLFPGYNALCIEAAGEEFMATRAALIEGLDPLDPRRSALERLYFGEAVCLGFDATGRISVPDALRLEFGIKESAVFVGVRDRFQIWNPEREQNWAKQARVLTAELHAIDDLRVRWSEREK